MPTPVVYAVDANVILRFVLGDHPELSRKARAVFGAMQAAEVVLACDPVNLAEVVWVLSSHYKASPGRIVDALLPLVKAAGFDLPDKERYLRALALYGQGKLRYADACVCATAEMACGGRLVSFDRALSRVAGVGRVEGVGAA
jgi:predicted nucleic acid-binding protein